MTDLLRVGLRTATILTIGATGWLVSVLSPSCRCAILGPSRCGSRSRRARRPSAWPRSWPRCAATVSGRFSAPPWHLLSAAVAVVGVLAIDSQAELPNGGHGEGYLLALGLILAVQGLLGLAWLAAVTFGRR